MRDWNDVLPPDVARSQTNYERRRKAWNMRQVGMKYREIGKALGVGTQRAMQVVRSHEWTLKQNRSSPIEVYLSGSDNLRLSTMRKFSIDRAEQPLLDLKSLIV